MSTCPHGPKQAMTPLDRRAIEVRVASAFHEAAVEIVGHENAEAVFAKAVEALACEAAEHRSGGDALSLRDLWEVWQDLGADNRLDLSLDTLDERVLRFHITRCAYAELYRDLGIADIGVAFSCRRDKPFAEALVPGVKVEQSRTILEGARECEFAYTLEDQ